MLEKKNTALFLHNNHFCLIETSEGISFTQALEKLKELFNVVDNYMTEENVNSHFEYIFSPKKLNRL